MTDPEPQNVRIQATTRAYHEDNFARSPELNMVFPTLPQYTADAYALNMFVQLFSSGKDAPLYKIIVEDEKLAPAAAAFNGSQEVTGAFRVSVRAFPGTSLTDVEQAIHSAFARFEEEGFDDEDLNRIKAQVETGFYGGISGVLFK